MARLPNRVTRRGGLRRAHAHAHAHAHARALAIAAAALAFVTSCPSVLAAPLDLGRGINFGNMLEAPREGDWGLRLESGYFDIVADAGFDSVRVPIRWSAHAARSAPYTIDGAFFERVDRVLDDAARSGLSLVLDLHHYNDLMRDPEAHRARFLALWRQIAERYATAPASVAFELLNEPHDAFDRDPEAWNALARDALAVVRRSNPTRTVLIGPVGYNAVSRLDDLVLPDDPNLVVTVHYYEPFAFTHQGASWVGDPPPVGTPWRGDVFGLGDGVQNWSWDTELVPTRGALSLRFGRQWAGFSPVVPPGGAAPRTLRLRARGQATLALGCAPGTGDDFVPLGEMKIDSSSWVNRVVDLSACPANTRRYALSDTLSEARGGGTRLEIRSLRVCDVAGDCRRLVGSAAAAVRDALDVAARWARARNVPLHLGEFGAHAPADLRSRARWTRSVRRAAQRVGAAWSYWEFGAGFGAWDPDSARWRQPLKRALLD